MSVVNLAKYVRDLLDLTTEQVEIGRDNFERTDFAATLIVVDEINSRPLGSRRKFDSDNEQINVTSKWLGDFTLDFFGTNAKTNVSRFSLLQKTEKAYELQRDLGIAVYVGSVRSDLKKLTGSQYSADYQLELKLEYNESIIEPTLRIDIPQVELITNT